MIKRLHDMGLKSGQMYFAGFASIGLSVASWAISMKGENAGIDRADRWGIYIGQWAPTFFAVGIALRIEETHVDIMEGDSPVGMMTGSRTAGGVRQPA